MTSKNIIILIVASTAIFFEALDIAIINLAIPLIQKQFSLTNDTIHWLQTLYLLPYGGFLIVGGKLSDFLGRKKIFMIGAALFLLTSIGAGLANGFKTLAFYRTIQGLGAALIMPSAFSIITNTFTENRARSKAIGIFSSFAAVGSGLGLSLGGIIATYIGWQWVFFVNVPIIVCTLWLGYIYIDKDTETHNNQSPDIISAFLLTILILILSFIVHELANIQQQYLLISTLVVCFFIGTFLFIYRNKRLKEPLINFSFFWNTTTPTAIGVFILLGAFFSGYLLTISFILQNNLNYSAAKAGLILFPFSILSALVSKFILPILLKRMTIHQAGILGMALMLTGSLAMLCSLNLHYNVPLLIISVSCVTGCGIAICFPTLMVMTIQEIPSNQHGLASSLATTSYFLGGGIGLSILSLFMQVSKNTNYLKNIPIFILGFYASLGVLWLLSKYKSMPVKA